MRSRRRPSGSSRRSPPRHRRGGLSALTATALLRSTPRSRGASRPPRGAFRRGLDHPRAETTSTAGCPSSRTTLRTPERHTSASARSRRDLRVLADTRGPLAGCDRDHVQLLLDRDDARAERHHRLAARSMACPVEQSEASFARFARPSDAEGGNRTRHGVAPPDFEIAGFRPRGY